MRPFLVLSLLLISMRADAAPPLFSDDFESGDANGWSAVYGAPPGARLEIESSQHWSGDFAGRITIVNASSKLQLEGAFTPAPKIYLRAAFFFSPGLNVPPGEWIALLSPANTRVGLLDRLFLKPGNDGKFFLSSQSCGDGHTPLTVGVWHTVEAMYAPGNGTGESAFWVNGILQKARSDLVFEVQANSVMAGALQTSWNSKLSGSFHLDDVAVGTQPFGPLQPACTLHHPDLRGRAGAKILAVLNGWKSGWQFTASVSGSRVPTKQLHAVNDLKEGAFHFPIELSPLPSGQYTLTALLKDHTGSERARWSGRFQKNYEREARLTLDSHNNVILDGKPFFPVTSFGLQEHLIEGWVKSGYINCLYGQNWWRPTTETMRAYAALGAKYGVPTIGPLNMADEHLRTTPLVKQHVLAARDNPNIVAYTFIDEPDYNGYSTEIVGEWYRTSKDLDGSRLVHLNLMGSDFVGGGANLKIGKDWTYPNQFADIYGFDLYPMWKPNFTIATLGDAADNLLKFNRGLIPFFAFVQTCNVEPSDPRGRAPTAAELRVMAWVLVVHGAKGIQWYYYGSGTSVECYAAMATFTREIKEYTPIILSTLPAPATECPEAKGTNAAIHLMSRQFAGKIYLFVANATAETKRFRCSLAGVRTGTRFGIAGRGETVVYGDTSLEDTLQPHEVRIYYSTDSAPEKNLKLIPR